MQHLVSGALLRRRLSASVPNFQAQVRFLAYHRIKPHAPPLVRAPANSFEFHRCRRTPQVDDLSLSLCHSVHKHRTTSHHRLQRGLPGYLILFAPHAFVPQRQMSPRYLPSLSVFYGISMNFTSTCHIPVTPNYLKYSSFSGISDVEHQYLT